MGGTPSYSYLWNPGGFTTASIAGLCAGIYSLTVTDANACTTQISDTLTEPPPLLANAASTPVTCNGSCDGQASATPSGGTPPYTYSWMPGGNTNQNTIGLCNGTYTVTVTDFNGCTVTQTVSIIQPPALSASISGSTSACSACTGSATVAAFGGAAPYTYLWNDPSAQTTATATGLCIGNYTVTVTDVTGCTANATVTINFTVIINVVASGTGVSCNGLCDATATANASGGTAPYTYLWSPTGQTTVTATGLCSGIIYTVCVTDANGCFSCTTVSFTNPPVLTASITGSTNVLCSGSCTGTATVTAGGGTPAYSYSWNTLPIQTTSVATGLCAGAYTVTITDANFCTTTATVTITQTAAFAANPTVITATCGLCDGSISLAPSGGTSPYTYLWAPNGETTSSITSLCPLAYAVTLTRSEERRVGKECRL